jgi:hypothetical protein
MKFLSKHRKFLHHQEGVEYFENRYGMVGGLTAALHVLDDTGGNLPLALDYYTGACDDYGVKRTSAFGEIGAMGVLNRKKGGK